MLFDRFNGVSGTGGDKTTYRRFEGRDELPIEVDGGKKEQGEKLFHGSFSISWLSSLTIRSLI